MLTAADCLNARAELAVEIARVRERDANGHVAHALVATLAIFLQPIANAPANIGFGLLVAMCALRAHRLWRVWALMFRDWFWLLLVAWAAWTGITLFWSEDVAYGFRQWTAFRAILWVPMLWPVIDRWRWLVGALLAGVAVANAIQVSQMVWKWPPVRYPRHLGAGLHHPSYMGTWCAVAFALWTMMAVSIRLGWATVATGAAAAAAVGLVLAATRGAVVGVIVEVALVGAVLIAIGRHRPRLVVSRTLVGGIILAITWTMVGDRLSEKTDALMNRVDTDSVRVFGSRKGASGVSGASGKAAGEDQRPISALQDDRLVIWSYSLMGWRAAPLTGIGYGSVFARTGRDLSGEGELESHVRIGLGNRHPHSMWIQSLAETGVMGFLLLASAFGMAVIRGVGYSIRLVRHDRPRAVSSVRWLFPGLLGGLLAFLVAAQFDGYQMSSVALSIGVVVVSFITAPLRIEDFAMERAASC